MSTKTSLYGVVSELDEIENAINGNGGEIDENQEVIIANIQHLLTTKTDGCVKFIESQEDLIDLAKQKIELLGAFMENGFSQNEEIETFPKPGFTFAVKTGGLPTIITVGDIQIELYIEKAYQTFTKLRIVADREAVEITAPGKIYRALMGANLVQKET